MDTSFQICGMDRQDSTKLIAANIYLRVFVRVNFFKSNFIFQTLKLQSKNLKTNFVLQKYRIWFLKLYYISEAKKQTKLRCDNPTSTRTTHTNFKLISTATEKNCYGITVE